MIESEIFALAPVAWPRLIRASNTGSYYAIDSGKPGSFAKRFSSFEEVAMNRTPLGMARMVSTKSSGNIEIQGGASTGYITVMDWAGVVTTVLTNSAVYLAVPASGSWSGSAPKEIFVWPSDANGIKSGNLMDLACSNNSLTSLDVSGLTSLNYLDCNSNSLTSLDVSGLTSLSSLYCNNNPIVSLNVDGLSFFGSAYTNLSCTNCLLSGPALNAMYSGLGEGYDGPWIDVTGNPGTTSDDPSIATNKGYIVTGT